ncbi:DUF2244 domain-containing protein [Pelagibacterium lentulum]|uniref:Membrane protein n=1 Tax=Pelagibacterium lentulum TaxID=2029865 RepID=A0A916R6D2_9HYPH|nr:DUF2244 domain-containing protein [Pelagibacterium lentulum]GGA37588.1 membrane protein [Pelagibacterium lentulum]
MNPGSPSRNKPLFAALLTPHRAMNQRAIRWFIAFAAIMASVPGLIFFAMGAWPIVGFLGLDVLLLYWALSASRKSGKAFEEITLWPDTLELRQVSSQGRDRTISFNPFFVRFTAARDSEDRIVALHLVSRDRRTEIGRFLNADDKARFASLFAPALNRAKA